MKLKVYNNTAAEYLVITNPFLSVDSQYFINPHNKNITTTKEENSLEIIASLHLQGSNFIGKYKLPDLPEVLDNSNFEENFSEEYLKIANKFIKGLYPESYLDFILYFDAKVKVIGSIPIILGEGKTDDADVYDFVINKKTKRLSGKYIFKNLFTSKEPVFTYENLAEMAAYDLNQFVKKY